MTRRFGGEKIVVSVENTKEITDVDDDDDASSSSTEDENKNASSSTDDDDDKERRMVPAPLNVYIFKENNSDILLRFCFPGVYYDFIDLYPTVLIDERFITYVPPALISFLLLGLFHVVVTIYKLSGNRTIHGHKRKTRAFMLVRVDHQCHL